MISDPTADMLTRIRNALLRNKASVDVPYSKFNESVATVLAKNGYLLGVKAYKVKQKAYKMLKLELKYSDKEKSVINRIESVSRPGLRVYKGSQEIKPVLGGLGMYVVSTSRGVMSSKDAVKKQLGGEIVCKVY